MIIKLPALRIRQTGTRDLYLFGIDGKKIEEIAGISRISKDADFKIVGYQRIEAQKHIAEIKKYIDSTNPMIPNSIVIAFENSVTFESHKSQSQNDEVAFGYLNIPDKSENGTPPGWIVDGQQRVAACREATRSDFKLIVSSFISNDLDDQREQFVLVNSAKPLPKSLIYELIPSTNGMLPEKLVRKKLAISVMQRLNLDTNSCLFERIKTITNPDGLLTDNSVIRFIENSLSDGYLYQFRDPISGLGDIEIMTKIVSNFFAAVKQVFREDWELPPSKSRLNHGAGLTALGYLMDEISLRGDGQVSTSLFEKVLKRIKPSCAWSSGSWRSPRGDRIRWNEIQNTAQDVKLLSQILIGIYKDQSKN